MSKYKFGDKVIHEKYGLCVITSCGIKSYGIAHNHPAIAQVPWLINESELTPISAWIACSEQAPEHNQDILGFNMRTRDYVMGGYLYRGVPTEPHNPQNVGHVADVGDDFVNITHWQPLPNPPQD